MNLPTSAACHDVPHARMVTRSIGGELRVGDLHLLEEHLARCPATTRPRIVSRAAVGCSKISLSMKCL